MLAIDFFEITTKTTITTTTNSISYQEYLKRTEVKNFDFFNGIAIFK